MKGNKNMTHEEANRRHQARRQWEKDASRARQAIKPLRNAVNATLKAAGFNRALEGRNGRIGYGVIVTEGFVTESQVWEHDRADHFVSVKWAWRGCNIACSEERCKELYADARAKQEAVFNACESNPAFICERLSDTLHVKAKIQP
jgi:hypothetical protein